MPNTTNDLENIDFAITKGTLKKPIYEMTAEEREDFYREVSIKIRERLFKLKQPYIYSKNGKIVAEYADGTVTIIR